MNCEIINHHSTPDDISLFYSGTIEWRCTGTVRFLW